MINERNGHDWEEEVESKKHKVAQVGKVVMEQELYMVIAGIGRSEVDAQVEERVSKSTTRQEKM